VAVAIELGFQLATYNFELGDVIDFFSDKVQAAP
jgi:hypothetical protein